MELRKDYLLDRWVIIAEGRAKRPQQLTESKTSTTGRDFFAPGNEKLTPPEIGRRGDDKKWKFRWFANKFPAVDETGNPHVRTDNEFYTFADAYGIHEIIVETPSLTKQLWDLSKSDLQELFQIYRERVEDLSKKKNIDYVTVFKNHGDKGGASLPHSHTQIVATKVIPPEVRAQAESVKAHKGEVYSRIIDKEKNSTRKAYENDTAIAFTPYASRFNYELWIFPKRHITKMSDIADQELADFTNLLYQALQRLKTLKVSFNYLIYYSPESENIRFHLQLTPRIATWAGFELSSGITINSVSPEHAASFYRGETDF